MRTSIAKDGDRRLASPVAVAISVPVFDRESADGPGAGKSANFEGVGSLARRRTRAGRARAAAVRRPHDVQGAVMVERPVSAARDLERRSVGRRHAPAAVQLHQAVAIVVQQPRLSGAQRIGRRQRRPDEDGPVDLRQQTLDQPEPIGRQDAAADAPDDAQAVSSSGKIERNLLHTTAGRRPRRRRPQARLSDCPGQVMPTRDNAAILQIGRYRQRRDEKLPPFPDDLPSCPCGFTPAELPVGLQIVGGRFPVLAVLQASRAFEEARPWRQVRPPL